MTQLKTSRIGAGKHSASRVSVGKAREEYLNSYSSSCADSQDSYDFRVSQIADILSGKSRNSNGKLVYRIKDRVDAFREFISGIESNFREENDSYSPEKNLRFLEHAQKLFEISITENRYAQRKYKGKGLTEDCVKSIDSLRKYINENSNPSENNFEYKDNLENIAENHPEKRHDLEDIRTSFSVSGREKTRFYTPNTAEEVEITLRNLVGYGINDGGLLTEREKEKLIVNKSLKVMREFGGKMGKIFSKAKNSAGKYFGNKYSDVSLTLE